MRYGLRWMLPGEFKIPPVKMLIRTVHHTNTAARSPLTICHDCRKNSFQHGRSKIHMSVKKDTLQANSVAELLEEQALPQILARFKLLDDQSRDCGDNAISQSSSSESNARNSPGKRKDKKQKTNPKQPTLSENTEKLVGGGGQLKEPPGFARELRVDEESALGTLFVDDPIHRHDFMLWLYILRFHARSDGITGVKRVWKGMRMRGIDLPIDGEIADLMWKIIIWTSCDDEKFLRELWEYASDLSRKQNGKKWKGLYETFVGGLMVKSPRRAFQWHKRLVTNHWGLENAAFFLRSSPKKVFRNLPSQSQIYRWVKAGQLYRVIIPFLCDHGKFKTARSWHSLLVKNNDIPPTTTCLNGLIEYASRHGTPDATQQILDSLLGKDVKFMQSSLILLISNRTPISIVLSLLDKYKPQVDMSSLSDSFWFRLLSHWAISAWQIHQVMQTYELRTGPVWDKLRQLFLQLPEGMNWYEMGVPTDGNERVRYFKDQVTSAAVVYKQPEQRENLDNTPRSKELQNVPNVDGDTNSEALERNRTLRDLILEANYRQVLVEVKEMRSKKIHLEDITIMLLIRRLLTRRRKSKRPDTWMRKGLGILDIQQSMWFLSWLIRLGVEVKPYIWKEILKRLGMLGRLKELGLLTIWLIRRYHPEHGDIARKHHIDILSMRLPATSSDLNLDTRLFMQHCDVPRSSRLNPLKKLFPASFIRSIVEWGFLTRRPNQQLTLQHLTWGIRLARKLQAEGVHVDTNTISRAVKIRLRALYGQRHPFGLKIDVHHVVRACEVAWGKKLNIKL